MYVDTLQSKFVGSAETTAQLQFCHLCSICEIHYRVPQVSDESLTESYHQTKQRRFLKIAVL